MHKNTKKKVTTHKITPPKKKSKYWLLVNIILDLSLNLNCRLRCFRSQMEPQWLRWAKCKKTHSILLVFLGIFLCGYWEIFFYFKRNQSGSETINSQSLSRCWGQMGSGGHCDKLDRNAPMGPEGTSVIRVQQIAPKWEGGPGVVRPSDQLEFVRHLCLYLKPPSFKIFS